MAELEARQKRNLELARSLLDAFNRGDIEAARPYVHPEGQVTSDAVGMVNPGVYTGFDGYMTWLGQWLEAWDDFEIEIIGVEPVGERHVVVDVRQTGRGRLSGVPVDQHLGQMWEIRDDQIVAFHLYPSPGEAVAVAEERERAAD